MKFLLLCLTTIYNVHALNSCYQCGHVNFLRGEESSNFIIKATIAFIKNAQGTDQNCIKQGSAFETISANVNTVVCQTHCLFAKQTVSFITQGTNLTYEYHIRACTNIANNDKKDGCNQGSPYFLNEGKKAMTANSNDPNTLKVDGTFCYCNNFDNCNTGIPVPTTTTVTTKTTTTSTPSSTPTSTPSSTPSSTPISTSANNVTNITNQSTVSNSRTQVTPVPKISATESTSANVVVIVSGYLLTVLFGAYKTLMEL